MFGLRLSIITFRGYDFHECKRHSPSPLTLTGTLNPWAIFLLELWDEIGYSEADRSEFKAINVTEDGFTNDLLTQHKMEAEKLSSKLETMRHILEVRQVVPFHRWREDWKITLTRNTSRG